MYSFLWGPLRLALGILQMVFAGAALVSLCLTGLSHATLDCAAIGGVATLLSRVLFHRRRRKC